MADVIGTSLGVTAALLVQTSGEPVYSYVRGNQHLIDRGGRVSRFNDKFGGFMKKK